MTRARPAAPALATRAPGSTASTAPADGPETGSNPALADAPVQARPRGPDKGLEFRHLRAFAALAEELHFGRAARRLALTQPPLSLAIQQLEAIVGARLFDRGSQGVRLTAAGEAFRSQADALLARADLACQLAREVQAGTRGRLRVGFVGSMTFRGLPQWLTAFQAEQPGIQVALDELNSQAQIDALLRDELDLGFVHSGQVPDGLQRVRVHAEPFLCCLPAGHALAAAPAAPGRRAGTGAAAQPAAARPADGPPIALARLRDEPFVLFSPQVSPDYHQRIVALCAAHGFHPRMQHAVRHWLSVVALVGQGMGVSVVPASLARAGLAGVVFRPLAGSPAAVSEVFAVWPAGGPALPARDQFLARVRAASAVHP